MREKILAALTCLVRSFLQTGKESLWDNVWEKIFYVVVEAEKKWEESGRGQEKKEWAKDKLLLYINDLVGLNWIQRRVVSLFLSLSIDTLLDTLNENLGKDWLDKVKEFEQKWKDSIFD